MKGSSVTKSLEGGGVAAAVARLDATSAVLFGC
jgi:hypothetical protein